MVAIFFKPVRNCVALALCGALLAMACGGDAPYEPLRSESAPTSHTVGGTVRDVDGKLVANALVTLEPSHEGVPATAKWMLANPGATSDSVPGRRATATNQSGRYAFDHVSSGQYILGVAADDHLGASQPVTVPASALTDTVIINVNLTPTGDFTGNTFLESATSHENTIVYVQGTSFVALTAPSGSYTIHGVPTGSYTVRATHTGYIDDTRTGAITTAGQTVTFTDMTLKINLNIAPVAQVTVASKSCTLDPVALSGAASTDADGTIVQFAWDFDNDGSVDFTSSTPATTHVYSSGTHHVKLRVTDNSGGVALAVATFVTVDADSVFVSATGSDSNPGTRTLPKRTIGAGISAAAANTFGSCPTRVIVAGDHTESPVFVAGIDVLGGFDATTWTRAANSYSLVNVQNTPALANNINSGTSTISGLHFLASNGQSGSPTQRNSIAVRVVSSSALTFADCRFESGNGANGPGGGTGTSGANGSAGANGTLSAGGTGGAGGSPGGLAGGNGGSAGGTNATAGGGGCGTAGSNGPSGTDCSGTIGPGGWGGNGCVGTNGTNATAQASFGSAAVDWTPLSGLSGVSGIAGGGGGGGGVGGTLLCCPGNPLCHGQGQAGNSGGGGGGGGGNGTSGVGGGGGGASFAVYLYDSSPGFSGCRFSAGAGAAGGAGGNGGSGGAGGAGGSPGPGAGEAGGNGGSGGQGGHGGAGSGGPGGLSFCVYRAGSSNPVLNNSTYITGSGGSGGAGGVRSDSVSAPNGPNGASGTVGP